MSGAEGACCFMWVEKLFKVGGGHGHGYIGG